MFQPYVPEDFDAFWAEVVAEARAAPLDFHRELKTEEPKSGRPVNWTETHLVQRVDFRGIQGQSLHGWIAYQEGARRVPAFLWVPPYGRYSMRPNAYGTFEGFVSMSFNFFGYDAFYQEEYNPARGYFAEGAEDPRTWTFRTMFQNAFIALRVLQSQLEVDEKRCASTGLSQGGGMSIWLGAHCPIVKAVCADMPFLSAMNVMLAKPVYRYPSKELIDFAQSIPLGIDRIKNTVSYFDTLNQATRCRVPTQVSCGLKDPGVRPENVESIVHALPGEKRLLKYNVGHDWYPEMIPNNRDWLERHLSNPR